MESQEAIELEEYRGKIRAGLESPAVPAEAVFARLEAKYQAQIESA